MQQLQTGEICLGAGCGDGEFARLADHTKFVICDQAIDITYIATAEGWLYLSGVLDLYFRRIVGWAMDKTMSQELVGRALEMALVGRKPSGGLIHHSDRGSQYAAKAY